VWRAWWGKKNACRTVVGKPVGKRPLGNLGVKGRKMHWSYNKCRIIQQGA